MSNTAFQQQVHPWLLACFGEIIANDREERNHRFLEEALELVQSTGCTQHEAHQLVDYVFNREVGDPPQEVGGVMVTLAALCLANDMDMHLCGDTELARVWTKVEQIRAKQAAKPKHSPLPQAVIEPHPDNKMKKLTFDVKTDEYGGKQMVLLHIDGAVIIPFESIAAYQKFAEDMLRMIPEITDNMV